MVRQTASRMAKVADRLGKRRSPLLPGYRAKILDGNHLAATERVSQCVEDRRSFPFLPRALFMSNAVLFHKWRKMLERVREEQLGGLLINRHIFRQFARCTAPYTETYRGGNLAVWMEQCYLVFATTAVRRMVEESPDPPRKRKCPKCSHEFAAPSNRSDQQSVSLVILLRDIEKHAFVFTRTWFRKRYPRRGLRTATLTRLPGTRGQEHCR